MQGDVKWPARILAKTLAASTLFEVVDPARTPMPGSLPVGVFPGTSAGSTSREAACVRPLLLRSALLRLPTSMV